MTKVALTIDAEFKALIPPLQPDELAQLEQNLQQEGCRDALVVWRDPSNGKQPILLDGHNRLALCQKLKLPFKTVEQPLPSRAHARIWIRLNQLGRRNLPEDVRVAIALKAYREQAALSKGERAQQAANVRWGKAEAKGVSGKFLLTEVAATAGISAKKLRWLREVGAVDESLVDRVEQGELDIGEARKVIQEIKVKAGLEDVDVLKAKRLAGQYDVIMCNPPWPNQQELGRLMWQNQRSPYRAVALEQLEPLLLEAFRKHTAADCHLWLWVNQTYLPVAFKLLEKAGMAYICTFVWQRSNGHYLTAKGGDKLPLDNCTFALYAQKGRPELLNTAGWKTGFYAAAVEADIPLEFYEKVREAAPGRRLDMFETRIVEGFEPWGREPKK